MADHVFDDDSRVVKTDPIVDADQSLNDHLNEGILNKSDGTPLDKLGLDKPGLIGKDGMDKLGLSVDAL